MKSITTVTSAINASVSLTRAIRSLGAKFLGWRIKVANKKAKVLRKAASDLRVLASEVEDKSITRAMESVALAKAKADLEA